ncbi:MAG: hypothetical protein ACTHJ5_00910 [Ilyomonas sp.]
MANDNNKNASPSEEKKSPSQMTGKSHGPQGIDKAPGEEEAEDTANFKENTQQDKQPVDADVTKENDRNTEK